MPDWSLRRGDRVLLRQLPSDFASLPRRQQDVLDLCLGRELEVRGLDDRGNVELDVGRVTQRSSRRHRDETVVVDAGCLQVLER